MARTEEPSPPSGNNHPGDPMRRLIMPVLLAALALPAQAGPSSFNAAAVIIGHHVCLRAGPGRNCPSRAVLASGLMVRVIGRTAGWYLVTAGKTGWVAEDYLRLSLEGRIEAGSRAALALSLAQSLLGCGYAYGRAGPTRFDCSGLTCYLFRQLGLSLPREAALQMRAGKPVPRSNLCPGDLVFFATGRGGGVSHVGIYLFDGDFIHASSGRGRVTTSTMASGYYARNFVAAARVLGG